MRDQEIQERANSTFAAVADKVGAHEAHRMFIALGVDLELLSNAYETYRGNGPGRDDSQAINDGLEHYGA
jgi:hypothetical protein